jgi:DnaJ-class molecular chaperone
MAQKPDFYVHLGIERTADEAAIRKAFSRLALSNNPDKKKTDKEREAAREAMRYANEAKEVLLDPARRRIYDTKGHEGLEAKANGTSSGVTLTNTSTAPPREFAESGRDFFVGLKEQREREEKRAQKTSSETKPAGTFQRVERKVFTPVKSSDIETPVESSPQNTTRSSDYANAGSTANQFNHAADQLQEATAKGVFIPAEELVAMKQALQNFMNVVDNAIALQKKHGGPKP